MDVMIDGVISDATKRQTLIIAGYTPCLTAYAEAR